jgi:hypothetical protein
MKTKQASTSQYRMTGLGHGRNGKATDHVVEMGDQRRIDMIGRHRR